MFRPFALFAAAALIACSAGAQTTVHYREGERVDPQDVAQILAAPAAGTTRSIRLLDDAPAGPGGNAAAGAPATVAAAGSAASGPAAKPATPAAPSAFSLPIQFAFDSTTILPSARDQLEALAKGIKLLPADRQVVIEGHTDAVGTDDYNQQLSLRRAAAVKSYLVQVYGIEPQRLKDAGYGKRQPIAGTDPFAPENRRVQFHGA